jgi:hypothetical protein
VKNGAKKLHTQIQVQKPPVVTVWLSRRRGIRYLKALMSGCYLVSEDWAESTLREVEGGVIAHERPYLIAGDREGLLNDGSGGSSSSSSGGGSGGGMISSLTASTLCGSVPFDSSILLAIQSGGYSFQYVPEASSQSRARAAIERADPTRLLFYGTTFVLWGEFECPPKQLSTYDAVELITLGGGRAVEFELETILDDAIPTVSVLKAAATASIEGKGGRGGSGNGFEEKSEKKDESMRLPRTSGLWTKLLISDVSSSLSSSSSSSSTTKWSTADKDWHQLLMTIAARYPSAILNSHSNIISSDKKSHSNLTSTISGTVSSSSVSNSSTFLQSSLPPLVILCDEPKLLTRLSLKMKDIFKSLPGLAMITNPEWLLNCCASYSLIKDK